MLERSSVRLEGGTSTYPLARGKASRSDRNEHVHIPTQTNKSTITYTHPHTPTCTHVARLSVFGWVGKHEGVGDPPLRLLIKNVITIRHCNSHHLQSFVITYLLTSNIFHSPCLLITCKYLFLFIDLQFYYPQDF